MSWPSAFLAVGEEGSKPWPWNVDWVESHEAGYSDATGKMLGEGVAGTRHAELVAKAQPESRLTSLRSQEEWDEFIDKFARRDKDSGEVMFVSRSGLLGEPEREDFSPDFDSHEVLAIFANRLQDGVRGGLIDVEVIRVGDRLRTFAFLSSQASEPALPGTALEEPVAGHLYLVAVPRERPGRQFEVRLALQGWGRVCSKFSPPLITPEPAKRGSTTRAEQPNREGSEPEAEGNLR